MTGTKPEPPFTHGQLERLAQALGDTRHGLKGSEIAHNLEKARIPDVDSRNTKWIRLYNAFVTRQNETQTGVCVVNFIHHALEPARYAGNMELFERRREEVNSVLAFKGLQFSAAGKFVRIVAARTLTEAQNRANQLRRRVNPIPS